MTIRPGDVLLYALSAERVMTWDMFKRTVDRTCVPDDQIATESRYVRSEALDIGNVLGHWEVVGTGATRRIAVAPPVLARLPWPGLPMAVLCGSRSPDTIAEILATCDSVGGPSLSMSHQLHHPYAPMRLVLSAESEEQMSAVGRALSVRYDPTPAAWSIAIASATVEDYIRALAWEERAELNWNRRAFDPELLRYRSSDGTYHSQLRLVMYSHPSGWDWRDWLWKDGESADVDRSWGRYCVLASVGRTVLHYDHKDGIATVPRQIPLPKLLARALTLSSGKAPGLVPDSGIGLRAYPSVPRAVFDVVTAKLHQKASPYMPRGEWNPT